MPRHLATAILGLLLSLTSPQVVQAGFVEYTLTTLGTGTVDATSFTRALMTFTVVADASNVVETSPGFFTLDAPSVQFSIEGVGSGAFLAPTYLQVFPDGNLATVIIGIGAGASEGGFGIFRSSELAGYNLASAIGPVTGTSIFADVPSYSTSLGVLSFRPNFESTFTATAVPEPSSLVLCGVAGIFGLAVVSRRKVAA